MAWQRTAMLEHGMIFVNAFHCDPHAKQGPFGGEGPMSKCSEGDKSVSK
jgi:hypothetical protein